MLGVDDLLNTKTFIIREGIRVWQVNTQVNQYLIIRDSKEEKRREWW